MARIVIVGGPKTGKSTLAPKLGPLVKHTDEKLEWSDASEKVSTWFDQPGPWVIEGVNAARALRKWLANNPKGKPCDELYFLRKVHVGRSDGQITMSKGVDTVMANIESDLVSRGVRVVTKR